MYYELVLANQFYKLRLHRKIQVIQNSPGTGWELMFIHEQTSSTPKIHSILTHRIQECINCTSIHTHILHTHIHTYIHTYTHTSIHTYIHLYIHTHIHTYTHTSIHTYIHTYIHTHTSIHTPVHTYFAHVQTHATQWVVVHSWSKASQSNDKLQPAMNKPMNECEFHEQSTNALNKETCV